MLQTVIVSPEASRRIRAGYPWAWEQEVAESEVEGDLVQVADRRGRAMGSALYCGQGPLRLRLLGGDVDALDAAFFEARIGAALARRSALRREAFRVVHAEADLLPGVVIDRYGDVTVLQTATTAMDRREELLAAACVRVLGARLVVARDDGSARDMEALPRRKAILHGEGSSLVPYDDAGSRVEVDVMTDPKTGAFLDQWENHDRARELARGNALDVFSCQGGFAMALARGGATHVTAIEQDARSAARIRANVKANGFGHVETVEGNAFDLLRAYDESGRRFDTVVLDPPAFAKRKSALEGATRAYREINRRALRMLRPQGVLLSCSCSGRLSRDDFETILRQAAAEARVVVQILERRGGSSDHPPLLGVPETDYLKCWVLRVVAKLD